MNINLIKHALRSSYSEETAHHSVSDKRKSNNRYIGQCAITALLVQEHLWWSIYRARVENYWIKHYWNRIDWEDIDLTQEQFEWEKPIYCDVSEFTSEQMLSRIDCQNRLEILRDRFLDFLKKYEEIEKEILKCRLCSQVDHFWHQSIYFWSNCSLLFIWEAPAKNGWKVTWKAWINEKWNIIPSWRILWKLLDEIWIDLFETTFTEAIKCLPNDRKWLKNAMNNCKYFLYKQIDLLEPNILITLWDYPTRWFLEYKKFGEVVWKKHDIIINREKYILLPIYHPSPISPRSYKWNVPIFQELQGLLK